MNDKERLALLEEFVEEVMKIFFPPEVTVAKTPWHRRLAYWLSRHLSVMARKLERYSTGLSQRSV